jgi:DNA-binding transcriptional regulator YiaG
MRPGALVGQDSMTKHTESNVAEMVKDLRAKLGLTQEQFAAKVGVTWSTVNRWENGRGKPSPLAMQQIRDLQKGSTMR